jgi:hypothetical protein
MINAFVRGAPCFGPFCRTTGILIFSLSGRPDRFSCFL